MDILKSLTRISTDYSFFERDQVLTAGQLNSITDYLDDQNRLTRVNLLGVGIACGLRVSLQGNTVKVSKGVGITTDGDLLYFNEDTLFDKFKLYDKTKPAYAPFYVDVVVNDVKTKKMIEVYELVRQGTVDKDAASLTEIALGSMVAVLFMESYTTDTDICSGTDCDNRGEDCKNTVKVLLVDNKSIELLKHSITEPNQDFNTLKKIVVARPLFDANIISYSDIVERYRVVCHQIHKDILSQLEILDVTYSGFLVNIFAKNPVPEWEKQLNGINKLFPEENPGIQYYYDFLKDVAETYNQFHEQLFFGSTCCCPGVDKFPKHLLLGNLVPENDPDENRTEFYPSPIVSRTAEQLNYIKFLARKIDMLIQAFQVPVSSKETEGKGIRITPSMFEDQPLEERAIPYYYQINEKYPIHTFWNYRLHQRGMDAYNYSYNARSYSAQGGAENPLTSQIGRFSFFRIEGHLGQGVLTVLDSIENEIKAKNLPFTVRSIMLGKNKSMVKKRGIRYTDLHRFHYLMRQDVLHRLADVVHFSGIFKQKVYEEVVEADAGSIKKTASTMNAMVVVYANDAIKILNLNYSAYQEARAVCYEALCNTMWAAGQFKYSLGSVIETEFTTPFDAIISNTHIQCLDWLDEIIRRKDEKEDEKLLFPKFISRHPDMEHFAGVVRGGTFVVVYDESDNVVADFMLPYYCCDTAEEEAEEPSLKNPGLQPDWLLENGVKIIPSLDKFVTDKIDLLFERQNPKISSLEPSYGEWGAHIIIQGVNFDPEQQMNIVAFNGTSATVLGATNTALTVEVPKLATTGLVTVKNKFGDAASPVSFIIPISFKLDLKLQPVDLSYDAEKGEVWVAGSTEENKGMVWIFGLEERKILFMIDIDRAPGEIALPPAKVERRLALVTHPKNSAISVIHMDERKLLEILTIDAIPRGVAISPDGRWGYVVSTVDTGDFKSKGIISVIDLSKIKVVGEIMVGLTPTRVIFVRGGLEAFVNNTGDGTISVIDATSHKVSDTIKVGGSSFSSPQEVAVSGDTYPVWTANGNRTASMIAKDHSVFNIKNLDITPGSVAVCSKGNQAFFVGPKDKALVMVDMRDGQPIIKVMKMSGIGVNVKGVATTPDDRGVIVVHPDGNAVDIFDARDMRLQASVTVAAEPVRCLVTDDNKYVLSICKTGKALSVIEKESVLP